MIEQLGQDRYVATMTGGTTALTLIDGMEHGLLMYAMQPEVIHAANRRSVMVQNRRDPDYIRPGAAGALMEENMPGTNCSV